MVSLIWDGLGNPPGHPRDPEWDLFLAWPGPRRPCFCLSLLAVQFLMTVTLI